ncbi:MAG: homoprotocatechuate degradation operon regulator HpaR [Pseudomonadales bacterium]|nr:homoprotocatechuate degradation operon regulator HpaR [Pseudomonadales bacterium]MDP6472851.1 homoprotocatechuate degradation operon regulator HpaR [Pseudomonadales bacterium]MDP6826393.1 homoprotocatechuate degradation operon regulator HpaR [Pseudomonadales bacterium]MDP6972529.1 homoprotocatechuate degradation operon regulator HpaR [Pseudomonadales bacterium]
MPQLREFSESLPMLLLRARETAMSYFRPSLHEAGLTEQQWRVLQTLHMRGESTAAGLASECFILAPSITRILRRLSQDGLIAVRRSEHDGRQLRVVLADPGYEVIERMAPINETQYALIEQRLHPERLEQLTTLLHDFIGLDEGA